MLFKRRITSRLLVIALLQFVVLFFISTQAKAEGKPYISWPFIGDTSHPNTDSLPFPIYDRRGDL